MIIQKFVYLKTLILAYLILLFYISLSNARILTSLNKRNYDTQHIKLVLNFNEQEKSLTGSTTLTIVPLENNFNRCVFHAKEMDITAIHLNNSQPLKFLADSEVVLITFPKTYTTQDTLNIAIYYYTVPIKGIYFNTPTEKNPQIPYQIFSHSEPIDARYWFPCYDTPEDKLTSEVVATVKNRYFLLSNGSLLNVHENIDNHTKTFHWFQDKPHVTYLISVVAGEYEQVSAKYKNIPLQYYVYKNRIKQAPNSFSLTPKMLDVFSQKFDYPYPWNKYAQIIVSNYKSRGMEHTSATTLVDNIIHDKRAHLDISNNNLIAHELAHQWFGNLVTCKDWPHLWLNEGFATYAEVIFTDANDGAEAAQYNVILQQQFYLEMAALEFQQPVVYENYIHPEEMFNHLSYQKASLVLHMLRDIIGDELFFKSLANYLNKFAFKSIETIDFINVVHETTGKDLNWFFNQWLYEEGHPEFVVNYEWLPDSNLVILEVKQVQQDSLSSATIFQIPVEIEIVTKNKKLLETKMIRFPKETFYFQVDSKPLMIRFDKNNIILKSLKFIKTQDECIFQLLNDENLWGRLNAITQLQENTVDTTATIEALKTTLLHDSFWAVRREAAYALELFYKDQLKDIFISGCTDPNPKVKSACVQILGCYESRELSSFFKNIATSDSSYWVVTEALYALYKTPDSLSFEFINSFINMESYNDMIQTAAFEGLREIKDKRSIPIALKFAKNTYQAFSKRYSALRLVEDIGIGNNTVEQFLIELLNDPDERIKRKVVQILGDFKTRSALSALKQLEKTELSDSVRRRVISSIKKIEQSLIGEW